MRFQSIFQHQRAQLAISRARWRSYSSTKPNTPKSPHAQWYADIVPAMIPIALLGSAVYLSLQLVQLNLSHEKYLDEARARVKELEAEVDALQEQRITQTREPTTATATSVQKPSRWWF